MRVALRSVIDAGSHPDLTKLGILDKVIVSIKYSYLNSETYKKRRDKSEDALHKERLQTIDEFKNVLLYNLKDVKLGEVKQVSISRKFESVIDEVLSAVDFIKYDITKRRENKDMLLSFPEIPIVLEVSLR